MKYRKKPVEVEAMQLEPTDHSIANVSGWMLARGFQDFRVHGEERPFGLLIRTLEGDMLASPGDYIVRGVQGEFYPVKPDVFQQSYEPVENENDED